MSEWTPKVGDRVMVGEHGPYRVVFVESGSDPHIGARADLRSIPEGHRVVERVPLYWLSSTPEPEPDQPTVPGALVRDGEGRLLFCSPFIGTRRWYEIDTPGGGYWTWAEIPRPVTVVLADPAEVETLRAERDAYKRAKAENDERFLLEAARQRERAEQESSRADDLAATLEATIHERDTLRESVEVARSVADALEAERDEAREVASHATVNADRFAAERVELLRRIDRAQMLVDDPGYWSTYSQTRPMMNDILRGES